MVASIITLAANWAAALDEVLTIELFASLAALALAGAAFLQGPVNDQGINFQQLKSKEQDLRNIPVEELVKAKKWYEGTTYPAKPKICDCNYKQKIECIRKDNRFKHETISYLIAKLNTHEAYSHLLRIKKIQNNFVKSFNYFTIGILEGISLDIIASVSNDFSNKSDWLNLWLSKPITPVLALLDIAFSVILLCLGLLSLYKAGSSLGNQYTEKLDV